jgi:CP family cyanate transporter-like MFS transporter
LPISLALLWLVGVALRCSILAVPPVIPALRIDLGLSGTEIGILTGLPVLLFAAAALVGSRLVARLGAVRAAIVGLLLAAFGSALRAPAPDANILFVTTVVMGAGVAVTQPAMPALVGGWLPQRIALGTGIYTNGLLSGEILPVALFPLVFPLLHESWRATFVFWGIPIALIAFIVMAIAPREKRVSIAASQRWWPAWPWGDIARLGLIFGSANALYFGANAFIPGYLTVENRSDLVSAALTALNLGQLPASLLLIGLGKRFERRAWPFVIAAILALLGVAGIVLTANWVTVACAALLGFSAGGAFALGLTLPPLLSTPDEVARVSGAMFTISYAATMLVSVVSGALWDATGVVRFAFLPVALSALPLLLLVLTIDFNRKPGLAGTEGA